MPPSSTCHPHKFLRSHLLQPAAYILCEDTPTSMPPMQFMWHFRQEHLRPVYFRYSIHFLLFSFKQGPTSTTASWDVQGIFKSKLNTIPNLSSLFSRFLGTVLNAPTMTGITVTVMFQRFFSSQVQSRYLSRFWLSFTLILWSVGTAKSTMCQSFWSEIFTI